MGAFDDLIPPGNRPAPKGVRTSAAERAMTSPQRVAALDALSRQLQDVDQQYQKNLRGFGPGSLLEYLPTPAMTSFNSAASGLSDQAQAAFRTPGIGSQSDRELAAFIAANQPSNTDNDSTIEQKIKNIRGRLVPQRRALGLPDQAPPLAGTNDGWKIERIK